MDAPRSEERGGARIRRLRVLEHQAAGSTGLAVEQRPPRASNRPRPLYTGSAVVFFTVRSASVDCTRTTPGNWVRMSVWMRSKSAESA